MQMKAGGDVGHFVGYLAVWLEIDTYGAVQSVLAVCDIIHADLADFRGIVGYDDDGHEV